MQVKMPQMITMLRFDNDYLAAPSKLIKNHLEVQFTSTHCSLYTVLGVPRVPSRAQWYKHVQGSFKVKAWSRHTVIGHTTFSRSTCLISSSAGFIDKLLLSCWNHVYAHCCETQEVYLVCADVTRFFRWNNQSPQWAGNKNTRWLSNAPVTGPDQWRDCRSLTNTILSAPKLVRLRKKLHV